MICHPEEILLEYFRPLNHINYLLSNGQIEKIGNRLKYMGWLYRRGNEQVRNIIENLFVRSFRE
ncbi:hypothetical protein KUH03_31835 [Sphingobacterium sp. E70]|uniref:DUF7674 family protein n=1 Tax=Sphingobacterium sp. E70 TaxID=2853439 RepID=UPI00211BE678|nr:hypothetical protein [Sphingobacterium sp. E70]ULT23706.1 hypothetical protein KUH03_31835 [Sphingobacterium sp. E70]